MQHTVGWQGALRNLGRAAYSRELGSGPMNGCDGCDSITGCQVGGGVDQTVPVTGRRELLGGWGARPTLSTRRAGSGGSCNLLSMSIISVRVNDKIPEPPKKGSN